MAQAEEPLLDAAVTGDREVLSTLLRRYGPEVRRQLKISPVWRTTIDPADVMQVTYLEAFLRIQQLEARTLEGFQAWLARLAHNNLRDAIRAQERQKRPDPRRRRRRGRADDSASTLLNQLCGTTARSPSRSAARRESERTLETALSQLPPAYAQVVRLHDLEGQSVVEVAQALGRSPGAVYMLRARALEHLQELLGSPSRFFSNGA